MYVGYVYVWCVCGMVCGVHVVYMYVHGVCVVYVYVWVWYMWSGVEFVYGNMWHEFVCMHIVWYMCSVWIWYVVLMCRNYVCVNDTCVGCICVLYVYGVVYSCGCGMWFWCVYCVCVYDICVVCVVSEA